MICFQWPLDDTVSYSIQTCWLLQLLLNCEHLKMFTIKKRLEGGSREKWGKSRECKRGPPPWPSLCSQDGWILTKFFLCIFHEQSTSIKLQKRTRSMSNHLERTSLVTKVFVKWLGELFLARTKGEILSGQGRPILLTFNSGFALSHVSSSLLAKPAI